MNIIKIINLKQLGQLASIFILCIFVSCKKETVKTKTDISTNSLKPSLKPDSIKKRKIILEFKNYFLSKKEKSFLNNKFLLDTLYGDCIFFKLGLDSLYESGRYYLLKKEIISKNIFDNNIHKAIIENIDSVDISKKFSISYLLKDEEFESSTIYNFIIVDNQPYLYSVNCAD
ncbi:hypothetical protein [Flagellimonas marinaquae]|uniref:hypothetical protein n=1 Tax=Flagellimonas marinaquae TaxID=254955 RepID=UPI0020753A23|nr:hypothetical protein [Allomuricauda aquimarina]USD26890.1 hypothetical protein MJO53_08325 [Allomuricauda aquimarina]